MLPQVDFSILDTERRKTLASLSSFFKEGYLAGGTALAIQIRHRYSYDFDIFFSSKIKPSYLKKLNDLLTISFVEVDNQDQLTIISKEGVRISLIYYYFPLISQLIKKDSIAICSVEDIAADKAYTIGRRAVWRDYVDIFSLIKNKYFTLNQMVELAQRKFKNLFNEVLFFSQLSYFKDIEVTKINYIKQNYDSDFIKEFLINEIKKVRII